MNEELRELRDIKRLLVLLLKSQEVDQKEIAKVLGLTEGRVSQMLNPKSEKNAKET